MKFENVNIGQSKQAQRVYDKSRKLQPLTVRRLKIN